MARSVRSDVTEKRRRLTGAVCGCIALLANVGFVAAQSSTAPAPAVAPDPNATPAPAAEPEPAPVPDTVPAPAPPPPPPPPPTPLDFNAAEKSTLAGPAQDVTSLNASGGGQFSTGNTKAYQITVGGDFRLVRQPHSLAATVAFAYGRAALTRDIDPNRDLLETIKNLNAKARYDFFLSNLDALFAATAFRWDPFAGINRRNQGQVGYARYFISEPKQRFWGEVGYDLTSDSLRQLPGQDAAPDPKNPVIHSARLFAGYDNQLNEAVTYVGGVEALMNVEKPGDFRVNWDNALRSSLSSSFKLELKFRLAWDRIPVPGAQKVDTATLVSILYTLI